MFFVSNSSTSSFIIHFLDHSKKGIIKLLTDNQLNKLIEFGFEKTYAHHPYQYKIGESVHVEKDLKKDSTRCYNYGYSVICNQDIVLNFLFKHKIPFTANIHYDQYTIIYNGGKTYKLYTNFGQLALMHYLDNNLTKIKPIGTINIKTHINY
jgi:hypothetical protein